MTRLAFIFAIASTLSLVVGCNESETGAAGNIRFTPNNCGRPSLCSFDDGVGEGGLLDVTISGISGFPTAGVELFSDDPNIFDVAPTADVGGQSAWELSAVSEGVTRLVAVDADDVEVDFIDVDIRAVSGLTLTNTIGNAVGPQDGAPDYDEIWTVQQGDAVVFWVYPIDDLGAVTMGRYEYTVTVDAVLDTALNSDPSGGRLDWTVPIGTGDYEASFVSDVAALDVLFEAP